MNDTQHLNDLPPLTIDQMRDLATAICENFGPGLSRADFTERLLMLLEDVPGFEVGEVDTRLIVLAWATYNGRPPNS